MQINLLENDHTNNFFLAQYSFATRVCVATDWLGIADLRDSASRQVSITSTLTEPKEELLRKLNVYMISSLTLWLHSIVSGYIVTKSSLISSQPLSIASGPTSTFV